MLLPTILLVDNIEHVLNALRDRLEPKGFRVLQARNAQEAHQYCREEVIHLAVIDIRLEDEYDPADLSGLLLADDLDPFLPKIILTGHEHKDWATLMRRVLGPNPRGQILATDFVLKKHGPGHLIEAIEAAFQNRIHLNPSLIVRMPRTLTPRLLVDQLKLFREADDPEKSRAEQVVEDLFRRLFYKASAVEFLRASPGYGPCTVVMVRPFFEGDEGVELAVKLGPRESIAQEVKNYEKYVRPFIGARCTNLWDQPVNSRELSAIAYSFIGERMEMLEDLGAYYANEKITDEAFCKALDDLFKGSCRKWYGTNRPLATLAHQPLDLCYREQLNLLDAQRVEELSATFNKLIQETPFNHLSLAFSGDGGLHVRLKERPDLILPDPIRFAFDDHSSTNGKTFFPPPSRTAITHGDMHSGNILISKLGRTWLIDFYKTGWGPALRDFAELESNIRYDLVGTESLRIRYDLEKTLLAPSRLNETIALQANPSPEQVRAVAAIQQLRQLAYALTDTEDVREYYIALLFYALRRVAGFTSTGIDTRSQQAPQYHALLSAAMICDKLSHANVA